MSTVVFHCVEISHHSLVRVVMTDSQVLHGCPEVFISLTPLVKLMFHVEGHKSKVRCIFDLVLIELMKTECFFFESTHKIDTASRHFDEAQFKADFPNNCDKGSLSRKVADKGLTCFLGAEDNSN